MVPMTTRQSTIVFYPYDFRLHNLVWWLTGALNFPLFMSSEIHYEGWLTKSPPTKRIWRAVSEREQPEYFWRKCKQSAIFQRWRKRWFALKQGELPGQYFLEYYTDQNCRKLKGMIELDQCEQVGLIDGGQQIKGSFKIPINSLF